MRQVPVPPELVPPGADHADGATSYTDVVRLPIRGPGADGPTELALVRTSYLWELEPADAKAMSEHGWCLWVRVGPPIPGGVLLDVEVAATPPPAYRFLDSDHPDHPDPGHRDPEPFP